MHLDSEEDAEYIVGKAIRDGVIEGRCVVMVVFPQNIRNADGSCEGSYTSEGGWSADPETRVHTVPRSVTRLIAGSGFASGCIMRVSR